MSNSNDSSSSNEAISSNSDSSSSSDDAIVNAIMCESSSDKEIILAEMIEMERVENEEAMKFLMARRASLRKKRRHTYRKREEAAIRLYEDYFSNTPAFNNDIFRRRFRMRRSLFERIFNAVLARDTFFHQKELCTGEAGLSPHQKMTAAIRLLAYGIAADSVDEYIRIGESTTYICLKHFCKAIIMEFGAEYLRAPNEADMARLLEENRARGFPGMIGSIDCMHWKWKNCPKAWQGAYKNYKGGTSIVLEAVASYDLWFWHVFFGMPGSYNDVNVLGRSGVFDRMMRGETPPVEFVVNNRTYYRPYYLGDGIYPKLSTIIKTIKQPHTQKEKNFAMQQEAKRKDVERAFGVFQGRWGIIRQPARTWKKKRMNEIMLTCVILHNMIVEDERGLPGIKYDQHPRRGLVRETRDIYGQYEVMRDNYAQIHDEPMHNLLRDDLIEHLWNVRGLVNEEQE